MEAVRDAESDLFIDVLEGLSSLVDKSLLRLEEGVEEEPRFVMLETIREYARERLEVSGNAEEIRRRHAEYFLALAERGESKLREPEEASWLERLDEEHDNMRAALSWTLQSEEAEPGLRLAGALWQFWDMRGYYGEGRRWLEEALAKDGRASVARAKALEGVGWLADVQGDIGRAVAATEEGLRLGARAKIHSSDKLPSYASLGQLLMCPEITSGRHDSTRKAARSAEKRGTSAVLHRPCSNWGTWRVTWGITRKRKHSMKKGWPYPGIQTTRRCSRPP